MTETYHTRIEAQRICRNCDKEFWIAPADVRVGHGQYCSRECYMRAKTGRRSKLPDGDSLPNQVLVTRVVKTPRRTTKGQVGRRKYEQKR